MHFSFLDFPKSLGEKSSQTISTKQLRFNRKSLKMLNMKQKLDISKMAKIKKTYKPVSHVKSPIKINDNKVLSVTVEKLDISNLQVFKEKIINKKTQQQKLPKIPIERVKKAKSNIKTPKSEPPWKRYRQKADCKYCGITVSSKGYLIIHERLHTGEKPYECKECDQKFVCAQILNSHVLNVHREEGRERLRCTICNAQLKNKLTLTEHMNSHKGIKPYKCETCGLSFTQSSVYRTHLKIHKGIRAFKCSYCDKRFRQNITRQNHEKSMHTKERPFKCELCEKTFVRSDALLLHTRRHKKIHTHQCEICSLKFYCISAKRRHMVTHTGERKYSCEICGYKYNRKDMLTVHMRKHTGERPYKCETCGKGFINISSLRVHERTHTDYRPHVCSICGFKFGQSSGLHRHMRRKHMEEYKTLIAQGKMKKTLPRLNLNRTNNPDVQNLS